MSASIVNHGGLMAPSEIVGWYIDTAMSAPTLRFRFFEPNVDTNRPFTDGTVGIEGFALERVDGEADAWEQGFSALVGPVAAGEPIVCIPAFPNRKFRLGYIQVRSSAGIEAPRDLEGRRVGIYQWNNAASVWARGALQNYYNVDLTSIDWRAGKTAAPPTLPAGIHISALPEHKGPPDRIMEHMLIEGELDAVLCPNVLPSISRRDPRVKRLFPDYMAEEQKYFKDTGIFPISHVVALDRGFVERHPEAPVALLEGHRRARDVAFDRIEGSDPAILTISWAAAAMAEQRALMGERYWAYNVADNRPSIEAMLLFAHQQGLTPRQLDAASFFAPEAANLPGW
jgi:4,5-dihydroxyphthalate decarboxylase